MDLPVTRSFNLKVLLLLSLGHLVTDIYQGSLPALLPFLKEKLALTYTMAAMIMLVSNLTSSVIQPLFGYVSDKKEKKFLLPLGCFVAGLGLCLLLLPTSYDTALVLVIISGLGVASYHPEGYKTAAFFTGDKMATGMSVFSVGGNLGLALGPIISLLIINKMGSDYLPVMIIFSFVFIGLFFLNWNSISLPKKDETAKAIPAHSGGRAAYTALILVIVIVVARSWTQIGLITFIPFYYIDVLKGDPVYAGQLVSAFLMGGVVGTIVGSMIADRVGHYGFVAITLLLSAIIYPLMFVAEGIWLVLSLGLIGAVLISSFTVTIVMAQQLLPQNVGVASGLMVGFAIGTGGIGATLIGVIADHFGVLTALKSINILPLFGFVLTLALIAFAQKRRLGIV